MNYSITNFLFFYNRNTDKITIIYYQSTITFFTQPAVYICLDIAYLVKILNCYYSNLEITHCNLIISIFRYLLKIFDIEIIFIINSKNNLINYIDFNYIKLIDGQNFVGSYIFILFGRALSQ